MKQLFSIIFCPLFIVSAMGSGIEVIHDDFKNMDYATISIELGADERPRSLLGTITFTREFKKNASMAAEMKFSMNMSSEFSDLEKKIFLKTDSQNYDLNIKEFKKEMRTETDLLARSERKMFTVSADIPDHIEKDLMESNTMVVRVYAGTQPATYTLGKRQIKKIKLLLTTKPKGV